ncbi:MAG TPA: serine/threonine-protein kinase [Gemmata sp.]|nr:serine/threonine-protein kinase [Gemmata sp.]
MLLQSWLDFLVLLVSAASAIVLWKTPPRTVRALRLVELVVVGLLVASTLVMSVRPLAYGYLEVAAGEPAATRNAFVGRYANGGSLLWFVVITLYGTLIPNTLRRGATVLSLIALAPVVFFAAYAGWVRPLDPQTVAAILVSLSFTNAIAVAVAVFGSSRIEYLRRQAVEARKLGQYVLRERLGAGGMGEVYRAEHALLRRPCAIKVIRPERAGDPRHLRRFEREVQATARLTHPNAVQVFDYGRADDGTFYYVMEFLPGLTLARLVARHGPLPPARAVHFLRQLCAALREAHGIGLIHRDIKPGNVMVCTRGAVPDTAKLLDFGLVLPQGDGSDTLTQDGAVAGTPAYLSPEQAGRGDGIDARSDVYSLGALAYFLLTGKPPFADRTPIQMVAAHLYEPPAPLVARSPGVPAGLDAVVLRCLAKDPVGRFADVRELDAALAGCCDAGEWTEADAAAWWRDNAQAADAPPAAEPTRTYA